MTTTARGGRVEVALRPSTDADREFLIGLYGSTREEELAQVP